MKDYLDVAAQGEGFKTYEQYFDFVSRDGEQPVVTAQLIEAIYKNAIRDCLTELIIENYSGNLSIEKLDTILSDIKSKL